MSTPTLGREFVKFRVRPDRPTFIGKRFAAYLTGKVLDVGCDQAVLKEILGDRYTGVGMTDAAEKKLDLEREGELPFDDGTWDTVMCLDTLEHLNNLYGMCNELFRIAREHVIISLPNCWCSSRRSLAKGEGPIWQYGLPIAPPPDRHKWFFNTEEAQNFLVAQSQNKDYPVEVVELVALENRRPLINRFWRRIKYPSRRHYLNLYPHTVVCVYKLTKKSSTRSI
ncbi:MAG TPA: class I SAM-dependent methyltransferase [Acidobacteriota bacterium]|nr:class I SAM-dependent methyltransferase [Acidobacteriota bacterium]